MNPCCSVVVALREAREAQAALPVARELATLRGGSLRIVHVADRTLLPPEVLLVLGVDAGAARGLVLDARTGDPASEIVSCAREGSADLVVLVSSGAPGPLASRVLQEAPVPVAFVRTDRAPGPWALRRILLPHDGTPATSESLGPAVDLARRAHAELQVLHVAVPGAAASPEPGALQAPRYMDQAQHELPEWGREFLDRLGGLVNLDEVQVRLTMGHGQPGEETVRAAQRVGADLVVLAWRGDLSPEHARVVRQVIGEAPCPVLVLRAAAWHAPPAQAAQPW